MTRTLLLALALALAPMVAEAQTASYAAQLSGDQAVPPNDMTGVGTAAIVADEGDGLLKWNVTFSGLSGPALFVGLHCGATTGTPGPASLRLDGPRQMQPLHGSIPLSDVIETALAYGTCFVTIRTAEFPTGEIRGAVVVPAPAAK